MSVKVIETKQLTKYYGKARGIIESNLVVNEGDVFGFIGPNGAGKSTTIRTILGMIKPTSGSAHVFGKDVVENGVQIRRNIGYMPSEAQFYPQMRVEDVIKLAANLHKKDCVEVANELCDHFQVDRKKKIEDLSLGNRKKISIVCALQHEPELLILDEPTSGLDPLMQKEFFDVLQDRNKKGTTIFLSSHVLPEIQEYCNRAAIIKEGRIIAQGPVEELAKSNAKRVTIYGIKEMPQISETIDIKEVDHGFSFLYKGKIKELLPILNKMDIKDLTITEPSLEEIFMHFYQ